jgi:hypothetical protein
MPKRYRYKFFNGLLVDVILQSRMICRFASATLLLVARRKLVQKIGGIRQQSPADGRNGADGANRSDNDRSCIAHRFPAHQVDVDLIWEPRWLPSSQFADLKTDIECRSNN